jgi:hypothetical protein
MLTVLTVLQKFPNISDTKPHDSVSVGPQIIKCITVSNSNHIHSANWMVITQVLNLEFLAKRTKKSYKHHAERLLYSIHLLVPLQNSLCIFVSRPFFSKILVPVLINKVKFLSFILVFFVSTDGWWSETDLPQILLSQMTLKMELLNICINTMYFLSEDKFY